MVVFDHGSPPLGYGNRKSLLVHLRQQVLGNQRDIVSFVYLAEEVPDYLTSLKAMAGTAGDEDSLLLMTTAEAAMLGSLEDPHVAAQQCKVVANLGNEHRLAFHPHRPTIWGIFDHHTHLLSQERLGQYLRDMVHGDIGSDAVWREQGLGSTVVQSSEDSGFLNLIGP